MEFRWTGKMSNLLVRILPIIPNRSPRSLLRVFLRMDPRKNQVAGSLASGINFQAGLPVAYNLIHARLVLPA